MKKHTQKLFLISVLTLGGFTFNTISPANAEVRTAQATTVTVRGTIVDSTTNSPVSNAFVKQVNTLNTVVSNESGSFTLYLQKDADRKLLITKDGYQSAVVDVSSGTEYKVTLSPIVKYDEGTLPQAHSETADLFNYSTRPISSYFSAFYQIRYQGMRVPTLTGDSAVTSGGWSINEVGVNAQLRFDKWLGSIKVFRSRYPIDVANFDFTPVYNLDTTQFQLGGGRVFNVSDKVDLYGGLSYLLHFNTPDNKGGSDNRPVPYTNSYMDYPQTRQGPGVTGTFGYLFSDKIIFNAGATLYPFVFTGFDSLSSANNKLGYNGMLEAGASIKVETLPGVYVAGSYTNQFFFGSILDDSNFFNIGISLDPFKMASLTQSSGNTTGK